MINRQLKERILALSAKYPIVTLTGPRQEEMGRMWQRCKLYRWCDYQPPIAVGRANDVTFVGQ